MRETRRYGLVLISLVAVSLVACRESGTEAGRTSEAEVADSSQKWGDLGNGFYRNPVLGGDVADMGAIRVGKDYYMVCSSHFSPGLTLWHSRDLINWEPLKHLLTVYDAGEATPSAPDFIKYGDTYYIYFNFSPKGFHVITAPEPEGRWSKPVDLGVQMRIPDSPSTRYRTEGLIDPAHLSGPDGKRYLIFSGGYSTELSADGLKAITKPVKIYDGWPIPDAMDIECFCPEGPNIIQRNGYYYLTTAQGGTCGPPTSHMAVSARSKSLQGPWENSPYNPIVHTTSADEPLWSQGQGVLMDTPDGDWYMLYHGVQKGRYNLGRNMMVVPVEWTNDGWFRVPPGIKTGDPIKMPKGEAVHHGFTLTDDFEGPNLDLKWGFSRGSPVGRYRFVPEGLALKAVGSRLYDSVPMVVTVVPYPAYEFTVELTVPPGAEGGATVYYNQRAHVGIGLKDGWVTTYNRDLVFPTWDRERYEGNRVFLRMVFQDDLVKAYYSKDGANWKKINVVAEVSGFQHNVVGGFSGLHPGVYAAGQGEVVFHKFALKPL